MRIDCPGALSQITSLNSGGREPLFHPSRPGCSLLLRCSGPWYVFTKSPRVRGVGARLLVWARCFDLPFRGVAAIHMGLDREKHYGPGSPPGAPSRLPPCRCGIFSFSAVLLCLLVPSFGSAWTFAIVFRNWLAHSRSVLTVDTILLTAGEPPFYTVRMQAS